MKKTREIIIPAIKSLAVFRKPEHIEIFASFTTHSDTDIIRAAIFAIGAMPNPQAADTLISFLCEDETINKLVVQALADKQELYDLEKITFLLSSPVTIIRDTAIDELINMGKKATPLLTKAFQNAEADYMVHLITTLGYIEDQAAIPAIMDIINTQPQDANIPPGCVRSHGTYSVSPDSHLPGPGSPGSRRIRSDECGRGPLTKTCPNHWWPD